jgi:HEAT repeat protein
LDEDANLRYWIKTVQEWNVNPTDQIAAAGALGGLGDPRAIDALLVAARSPHANLMHAALRALVEIGVPGDRLISMLIGGTADERRTSAQILQEAPDPAATEALIACMSTSDDVLRMHASEALAKIGSPASFESLVQLLSDRDRYVRAAAAEGLGRIGNPEALEPLIKTLEGDPDWRGRKAAAEALANIPIGTAPKKLKKALRKALKKALSDQNAKYAAQRALERIE